MPNRTTDRLSTSVSSPLPRPRARLALADGTVFSGDGFGAINRGVVSIAEVVFNTAVSGYQESLTDPSYSGQILVQTFPLIGNTGVNAEDVESRKVQVSGFVVRELTRLHSNYRADESLEAYLARSGVLGISGIDTRRLTRVLRSGGSTTGVLTDRADLTDAQLIEMARSAPSMAGQNLVPAVGCNSPGTWTETLGDWKPAAVDAAGGRRFKVLTLDCGAKANILRNLAERGCELLVVPHDTPAAEILAMYDAGKIDGVLSPTARAILQRSRRRSGRSARSFPEPIRRSQPLESASVTNSWHWRLEQRPISSSSAIAASISPSLILELAAWRSPARITGLRSMPSRWWPPGAS